MKKARTPKVVNKGLEAAFRKRQNLKLKERKHDVLNLFQRVMSESSAVGSTEDLRQLFRDVSELLSVLGLSLGGSEDWADRLYIEDKKGDLLFSEEELDLAEESQKRMEVMYNVDAWSIQLDGRIKAGLLLLKGLENVPHEDVLQRVLRRLEEDLRYHAELLEDPTSRLILQRIENLKLPCEIMPQCAQLLSNCSALYTLAVAELKTVAASCEQIKLKAMRSAAAAKVSSLISKVRGIIDPLQMRGVKVPAEQTQFVNELAVRIEQFLPNTAEDSDDDDYY